MSLKSLLLKEVADDPEGVRDMLRDTDVVGALGNIGVLPKLLELHAPSKDARKANGLGSTLCGIRGTRHRFVTCMRCRRILSAGD